MSLDDEYADYLKQTRQCKICKWLEGQEPDTRDFFHRRGRDNTQKMAQFAQEKLGMEAGYTTLRRHFSENHDVA